MKVKLLIVTNVCLILLFLMTGFGSRSSFRTLDAGEILLKSPHSKANIKLGFHNNAPCISMTDETGQERIAIKSEKNPGFYLKNEENKTIATWTVLADGGAGFGLADKKGGAATILRGGSSPSVSFFTEENEPTAALGMIQKTPHLLISGKNGNEGILIHGGKPSSMVFVDELGKVKILISKHGVFQGKKNAKPPQKKKDKRVFSFDDKSMLFPEEHTR